MESIPPHARGFVSGPLQSGYPAGYFMALIVYGALFPYIGWRGMFMVGVIPALLVLYIRRNGIAASKFRHLRRQEGLSTAC